MFKTRSHKKELLDGEVKKEDLIQNLKELHIINKFLGGYAISTKALLKLGLDNKTIVDIGSGGGDTLNEIHNMSKRNNFSATLIGIDLKDDCVNYSRAHLSKELKFICDDYRNVHLHAPKVDILHACLFTHHLNDREIIELIQFTLNNKTTLVINDLHRNKVAYYSIKLLTTLFSKSNLVKNDAPLSVLRGFTKKEWLYLIETAGAKSFSIKWKWAFRHLIIVHG